MPASQSQSAAATLAAGAAKDGAPPTPAKPRGSAPLHTAASPAHRQPAQPSSAQSPAPHAADAGAPRRRVPWRDDVLDQITAQAFGEDPEFLRYGTPEALAAARAHGGPQDFILAVENEPHEPDDVFARLRWGGQFVYASTSRRRLR